MFRIQRLSLLAAELLLVVCLATPSRAAFITVDEFGNGVGTIGQGFIGNDPGPGGLNNVLIYNLPFAGVQGDVFLTEPGSGAILDVLRFNGDGTLIFYSDNTDGFDAPADTPSPPGSFYTNTVTIPEVGTELFNSATYTPTANQPGFRPGADPLTYVFVSDGVVPEPSSIAMLGLGGLLALGAARCRRRSAD